MAFGGDASRCARLPQALYDVSHHGLLPTKFKEHPPVAVTMKVPSNGLGTPLGPGISPTSRVEDEELLCTHIDLGRQHKSGLQTPRKQAETQVFHSGGETEMQPQPPS